MIGIIDQELLQEKEIIIVVLDPGKPMAQNKEEIQYKIMAGDNSNLTDNEKLWYFHTANPDTDSNSELNPHFDSLEGLKETTFLIKEKKA